MKQNEDLEGKFHQVQEGKQFIFWDSVGDIYSFFCVYGWNRDAISLCTNTQHWNQMELPSFLSLVPFCWHEKDQRIPWLSDPDVRVSRSGKVPVSPSQKQVSRIMQIGLAESLPLKQAQKPQTPTKLHKTELWPRGSTWQLRRQ